MDKTYDRYRVLKKVVATEKRITFKELFEEYVADRKEKVRPSTFKNKHLMALKFLRQHPAIGNIEIDVEEFEVDGIVQSLKHESFYYSAEDTQDIIDSVAAILIIVQSAVP